ncbi:Ankyrin repeat domain-containing protein [Paramyrothecium foliicola]|nr:Ankyrin repeat domain-containing protein [Paramyrothecium foliicola]
MALVHKSKTPRLRDEEWESWKGLIRIKYLDENKKLEEVVVELRDLGFMVTKSQLEAKLKTWRLQKNLRPDIWRYILHLLEDKRAMPGSRRLTVYTADKSDVDHVLSQTARKEPPTMPTDIKLQVLSKALEYTVRRCVDIIMESEELAFGLFARRSIDIIAARFDAVMPETYQDENLQRAAIMVGGHPSEVLMEALKVMIYLISNNLLIDKTERNFQYKIYENRRVFVSLCRLSGLAQPRNLRHIIRLSRSNFTLRAVIDVMFDAAANVEAADIVSALLAADGSIEVDKEMAYLAYDTAKGHGTIFTTGLTPLHFAVSVGSLDLITTLLDGGAMIHAPAHVGAPLLVLAIQYHPLALSTKLARLLLSRGAPVNDCCGNCTRGCDPYRYCSRLQSPLQAAIAKGNLALIEMLVEAGANLNHRSDWFQDPWRRTSISRGINHLENVGCLGYAASFVRDDMDRSTSSRICTNDYVDEINNDEGSQPYLRDYMKEGANIGDFQKCNQRDDQNSLELCQWIVSRYGSRMDLSGHMVADAMILAAIRNYTGVLLYLHHDLSAPIDVWHGSFNPLYAAVLESQFEACQLLLDLGLPSGPFRSNCRTAPYDKDPYQTLSLLHVAVRNQAVDIAELLIRYGAFINQPSPVRLLQGFADIAWPVEPKSGTEHVIIYGSPFYLLVRCRQWTEDMVLLLLGNGATTTPEDLSFATQNGDRNLTQLLTAHENQKSRSTENGNPASEITLTNGHSDTVISPLDAGIETKPMDLASMFRKSELASVHEAIKSQTITCSSCVPPSPDGRSYLENALLSSNEDVINFALSLDTKAYDSGSLCAAVLSAAKGTLPNKTTIFQELLRRRRCCLDRSDPVLENTALSLATFPTTEDIFAILMANRTAEMIAHLAVIPTIRFHTNQINLECAVRGYLYGWCGHHGCFLDWQAAEPEMPESSHEWHNSPYQRTSPIIFPVLWGNVRAIQSFLDAGYKADGAVLESAILRNLPLNLIERIASNCLDIDAKHMVDNLRWEPPNPLCIAVKHRRMDIVQILLDRGADINYECRLYKRALGDSPEIEYLTTPLREAVSSNSLDLVCYLLNRGASNDEQSWLAAHPHEVTTLQMATAKGFIGIVKTLLTKGADPNAPRKYRPGLTALESAAARGRLDVVQLLLNFGVRTKGVGRVQYLNAIRLADGMGFTAVVDLLRTHREWSPYDQELEKKLRKQVHFPGNSAFLHMDEHPIRESVEIVARMDSHDLKRCYNLKPSTHPRIGNSIPNAFGLVPKWHKDAAVEVLEWLSVFNTTYPHAGPEIQDDAVESAWQALERCIPCCPNRLYTIGPHFVYDPGQGIECGVVPNLFTFLDMFNESANLGTDGTGLDAYEIGEAEEWLSQRSKQTVLAALETWKTKFMAATMSHQPEQADIEKQIRGDGKNCSGTSRADVDVDQPETTEEGWGGGDLFCLGDDAGAYETSETALNFEYHGKPLLEPINPSELDERGNMVLRDMLGEAEAPFMPMDFTPYKTGLAIDYVHWLHAAFPDISVFWIDARDKESFQESCIYITREIDVLDKGDATKSPYRSLKQFLRGNESGSWVLILENISNPQLRWGDDDNGLRAVITGAFNPIIFPGPARGCILTTTGSSIVAELFFCSDKDVQFSVETLATDADMFLQETIAENVVSGNDALLRAWLGSDYAAHEAANECIRANSLTISGFLQLFTEAKSALMRSQLAKHSDEESPVSQIAAAWMISFDNIQRQNDFAGELLSLMGFFAYSRIPVKFFARYREWKLQEQDESVTDEYIGRSSRAAGSRNLTEMHNIEAALNLFKRYTFIKIIEDCLSMDPSVHVAIRDWLCTRGPLAYTKYARHALGIISDVYPDGLREFLTSREQLAHAHTVLNWDGLDSSTDKGRKADVLHNIAGLYMAQFEWEDAGSALSQSLRFKTQVWGATHESTIKTMERLVMVFRNQGWVADTRLSGAQVWDTTPERFMKDSIPPMLTSESMLGLISYYEARGQWREAERLQVSVFQARKVMFGSEHRKTTGSALSLARILGQQGRQEDAQVLGRQAMKLQGWLSGSNNSNTTSGLAMEETAQLEQNRITDTISGYGTSSDSGYASLSRSLDHTEQSEKAIQIPSEDLHGEDFREDIRSIVSDEDDIGSQVSEGSKDEVITGQALMRVFFTEQPSFRYLCDKALAKMGATRFQNNLRRLLKSFHKRLHVEAKTEAERAVAGLLRSRRGRLRISQQLVAYIKLDNDEASTLDPSKFDIAEENQERVEIWLTRATQRIHDSEVHQVLDKAVIEYGDNISCAWDTGDEEEEDELQKFHHTSEMKDFLRESASFRWLQQELIQTFLPVEINDVLQSIPKSQIKLLQSQDDTLLNHFKSWVEERSGIKWNWWPLKRRNRRLHEDEARISWRCTCGSQEWAEVSTEQLELLEQVLSLMDETPSRPHWCRYKGNQPRTWWSLGMAHAKPTTPSAAAQKYTPSGSTILSSSSTSTTQASAASLSTQSSSTASFGSVGPTTSQQPQTSANQLSQNESWILFGAQGSRRTLFPVQISINSQMTDYNLFQELKRCYQAHRGWFKLWFSIWRLDYCEVVRFNRLTTQRIVREFRDLPVPLEYEYNPRAGSIDARNPPISPHQFHALFYGCDSPCKWVLPHDCMSPPTTVTCLERIPKRTRNFLDQASPIWGFEAVFEVSFAYVLLYHFIMVAGPFAFWAWWIAVHPGDLQNASIPMTVALGALSLFWSSAGILTSNERMRSVEAN